MTDYMQVFNNNTTKEILNDKVFVPQISQLIVYLSYEEKLPYIDELKTKVLGPDVWYLRFDSYEDRANVALALERYSCIDATGPQILYEAYEFTSFESFGFDVLDACDDLDIEVETISAIKDPGLGLFGYFDTYENYHGIVEEFKYL